MRNFFWGLALCCSVTSWASYRYEGAFQRPHFTGGADCQTVFEPSEYASSLFLMPQMRAVVNFRHPEKMGFFHALNLYGLNGGFGDVGGSNEWQDADGKWVVSADGIFSYEVLFLNIRVEKFLTGEKKPACTAIAEYSATN